MKLIDVMTKICEIPIDFERRQDVSMLQLMAESGYPRHRREITEPNIQSYLKTHPELIDAWERYSDDQRCSPSWAFRGKTVAYIGSSGRPESEQLYPDAIMACAAFVKRIMEMLYDNGEQAAAADR